ncbi:hypothetical protein CJF32_00010744 [Rutstroemia sp. NJR-2017a WRK4]|nr:hypothetical protein CJF32_00010744 [Rutstroemia sp. NJR-2017a WRK4]
MKFNLLIWSLVGLAAASPVARRMDKDEKRNTPLNAFLTILLEYLPPIDGTISAVTGVLTAFENLISDLTGVSDTYNQLGGACTKYTVIFARGTSEPGNVGILVGPPFFYALEAAVGTSSLTIQGVNNYAASVATYLAGGDPVGSAEMAKEIKAAYASCPNTKLVVAGYSQGGQLVHNSIALLPAAVAKWISSVVIFGDPDKGQAIPNVPASKVVVYCGAGDNICANGDLILPAHLVYAENAAAAAAFVVAAAA